MRAGITVAMLDAGLPVTLVERNAKSLERGRANVEKVYDALVEKKRIGADAKAAVMALLTGATSYDALASVDLAVEAVFEDMAVKQACFRRVPSRPQAGDGARHQHLLSSTSTRSPPPSRARKTCSDCTSSRLPT